VPIWEGKNQPYSLNSGNSPKRPGFRPKPPGFQTWQKAGKSHPSARAVLRHPTMKLNSEMRTTEYTESQGVGFVMANTRKMCRTNNRISSFSVYSVYSVVCNLPF
jgi:hypothetical protein